MISFIVYGEGGARAVADALTAGQAEFYDDIFEIADSFSGFSGGEDEFGFALFKNLLLVRISNGEMYAFVYPIALEDGADEREALFEIGRYAVREEIPLVFCDVPSECVSVLEESFRFTESFEGSGAFTVSVLTELARCLDIPEVALGELSLSPLCREDIFDYARLCRDRELNKYWGYDVSEDAPFADDEYFYDTAIRAEEAGVALSLAVRQGDMFVGEGVIWGFDLHGGAELAFRILPEFQGKGFGRGALSLLIKLGEELSLIEMRASVKTENLPSVKLLDSAMVCCSKGGNVKKYLYKY